MVATIRTLFDWFRGAAAHAATAPRAEPSDMTAQEFATTVRSTYQSVDAAARDLGATREELTLWSMGRTAPPERVARLLRWRSR